MNHLLSNWFYANTSNRSWYDVIESSTVRQDVCPTIGLAGLRISFRDSSVQATQYFEQDVLMLNPDSNTEFKPTRLAFIPLRSLHGAVGFLFPTLSPPVIPFVFSVFSVRISLFFPICFPPPRFAIVDVPPSFLCASRVLSHHARNYSSWTEVCAV